MDWNHILNWRLLSGSHDFPGPDGGTCINEAAIVAAGFKYKSVVSADDCPSCFSRPLSAYAIGLNDAMPDGLRQKLLLPFVLRLAGSADTPEIERTRAELIVLRTVREILPLALRACGLNERARACEAAGDLVAACDAARAAARAAYAADADAVYAAATCAANSAAYADAAYAAYAAASAASAAARAADAAARAADADSAFVIAASILDEALRVGKQAEPIDLGLAASRMEAAKRKCDA